MMMGKRTAAIIRWPKFQPFVQLQRWQYARCVMTVIAEVDVSTQLDVPNVVLKITLMHATARTQRLLHSLGQALTNRN